MIRVTPRATFPFITRARRNDLTHVAKSYSNNSVVSKKNIDDRLMPKRRPGNVKLTCATSNLLRSSAISTCSGNFSKREIMSKCKENKQQIPKK